MYIPLCKKGLTILRKVYEEEVEQAEIEKNLDQFSSWRK